MIGQPIDLEDDDARAAGPPDLLDDRLHLFRARNDVAPVQPMDGQAVESLRDAAPWGQRIEGSGTGLGGNRIGIVFDPEEHGQLGPDRLGDRLQDFTLLGGPVAHRADDDRTLAVVLDRRSDAHGLQGVVADRADGAQDAPGRIAHVGAHLATRRVRCGVAKRTVEEHHRRDPARSIRALSR